MSKKTYDYGPDGNKTIDHRQRRYLSPAFILEETQSLPSARKAVIVLSTFVVVILLWASITQVDETAIGMGEVIPRGQITHVQHLEGGIIKEVLVKNGEVVVGGRTVLARLDPVAARSELDEKKGQELSMIIDAERLRSFVNERDESFEVIIRKAIERHQADFSEEDIKRIMNDDELLFKLQNASRNDQRLVVRAQIEQLHEEARQLREQQEVLQKHLNLLEQEKKMYVQLPSMSKRDFLEVLRQVNRANGDLLQVNSQVRKNQEAMNEARQRYNELDSSLKENAVKELDSINSQLVQLQKTIFRLKDKVNRLEIIAPVDGVIHDIKVSAGSVITGGGEVMSIVPKRQDLIIEAKISPKDIGHIKVGDDVKIKVMTYNFSRYGTLAGKLESISASTTIEEKDKLPYYKVIIKPAKNYVGQKKGLYPILPGMTVQADIITGSKSVLSYLVKPVHRAMMSAMHER